MRDEAETGASANRPRPIAKGLLVFAGVVIAALLVEASLQVVSLGLLLSGREPQRTWFTDGLRVLALGDSNTFGLYLEAHESYPSQLETLWNDSVTQPRIEVINLGYPSTNSSRLLANFERLIDAFAPGVVLVQIGVNDYWTAPVALEPEGAESGVWRAIRRHSRLYKLLYILRRSAFDPEALEIGYNREAFWDRNQDVEHTGTVRYRAESFQLSEPFAPGSMQSSAPAPTGNKNRRLADNLRALIRIAGERGVEIVLLTYPSEASFYGGANEVIRRAAAASGAPLADPGVRLAARCPRAECPELFLPDHHATALGNTEVARVALETLAERARRDAAP